MKHTKSLLDSLLGGVNDLTRGQGTKGLATTARGAWDGQSTMGKGAIAGGLLGVLLSGSARRLIGSGVKVGGAALIGGLAYKAYTDWQQGKPAADDSPVALPKPEGAFEIDDDFAERLLQAMVAAAKADGHVDERERGLIAQGLQQAGAAPELQRWLEAELAKPLDPLQVASAVDSPELASEVYLLSRTVIEQPTFMEQAYLDGLAQALALEPGLRQRLDVQSAAITQSIS